MNYKRIKLRQILNEIFQILIWISYLILKLDLISIIAIFSTWFFNEFSDKVGFESIFFQNEIFV